MTDDPNAVDEVRMFVPRGGQVEVSSVADITRAVRLPYFVFKPHAVYSVHT